MITEADFAKGKFWTKGIQLVDGCTKKSPGCRNCWSEAMTARFKRVPDVLTDGRFNGIVRFNLHLLEKAAGVKKPHVYAIWNDMYHENIDDRCIKMALQEMYNPAVPWAGSPHTWLIITKRPDRAADFFTRHPIAEGIQVDNIIHIATMEDQKHVDKRMGDLLRIPGKRGIIIEPMLGPVNLDAGLYRIIKAEGMTWGFEPKGNCNTIHQVILGPENGKGKREFKEEWAESVRQQCEGAGVPFYRKDKGEGELIWK